MNTLHFFAQVSYMVALIAVYGVGIVFLVSWIMERRK
jgi:hypothetical protein